jgi:hypothetical protein
VVFALVLLAACGDDSGPTDGGGMDASREDGGGVDASIFDAGTRDAQLDDGAVDDASIADADVDAQMDSGPVSMPCTPTGSCNPFDPSPCPSGQKCRVLDTGTQCADLTATPPLGVGDTCTLDTQCGPGLWCVSFGDGFSCRTMCAAGSIGECGPDAACTGAVGAEACVRVCRPIAARCDIYTQDCAVATEACTFATHPETGERYTGCRPEGTLTVGETCGGAAGACARGLVCIASGGASSCRQVCGGADGGVPTCTVSGESCTGLARSWGVPYCQ